VSSRLADESLWAEVLNLGGYDLLQTPFEPSELFRVLHLAWLSWERERDRTTASPLKKPIATTSAQTAVSNTGARARFGARSGHRSSGD
jgi:hypothetical protein